MTTIRILTYGIEESSPFDFMSNLSTSFIYIGVLVKNKYVPHEFVKWPYITKNIEIYFLKFEISVLPMKRAMQAFDVTISLHGVFYTYEQK